MSAKSAALLKALGCTEPATRILPSGVTATLVAEALPPGLVSTLPERRGWGGCGPGCWTGSPKVLSRLPLGL
jgi:hypothetical protein